MNWEVYEFNVYDFLDVSKCFEKVNNLAYFQNILVPVNSSNVFVSIKDKIRKKSRRLCVGWLQCLFTKDLNKGNNWTRLFEKSYKLGADSNIVNGNIVVKKR